MRQISIVKRAISGLAAGVMLMTAVAFFPAPAIDADAASACTVNTDKLYQTIRGFGGMNHPEWQSYNGGGDMTAAQVQTAFGNGDGELGLSVLRIFVSDDQSAWKNAIPTAQRAQKLGATVFATPWNPPASIRHNGSGGSSGGKYVLNDGAEAAYAKHLNDFVKYCDSQGVHLNSISVQNEPDFSEDWTAWTPERTTTFIANYGKAVTEGTTTKLMSPESFQYAPENASWVPNGGKKYYTQILNNAKAFENCDIFGTHFYGTAREWMDFPALEASGKEIWMTEVYVPNSEADSANRYPEALQVSENIHNGLVVGNMSAYVWWYIRRSYGLMTEDGKPSKRGYCMAQYSKYIRPGDVRIDCTESPADDLLISAYKHSDTQIEIVAINKGSSEVTQEFNVGSRAITNVDRYRTSASENLAKTAKMEYSGSKFYSQLPANSVSTYVVTLTSDGKDVPDPEVPYTPEPIEPDANGYYYHDTFENGTDDWEPRGASTLTLSGKNPYAGTNALLVQERGSAWQGVAKQLDTNTFKAGESYSFSVCVTLPDGVAAQDLLLSIQYTDADGETQYGHIAQGTAVSGAYVQLANTSYTIPAGAKNPMIYVESAEGTDNFYIDEAIVAKDGTVIPGPDPVEIPPVPTETDPDSVIRGDLNGDGVIDVFDLALAKRGVVHGFSDAKAEKAADISGSGKPGVVDIVSLTKYLHGKKFPAAQAAVTPTETPTEAPTEAPIQKTKSMAEFTAECAAKVSEYDAEADRVEKAGVQYGTIQSGKYYSTTCKREKPYNILLPAGYDTSKKYPVLYVMHGYWENQNRMITEGNGTMYTRQLIGNAIASGEAKDMIVVFPYIYSSDSQDACSGMDDFNNAAYDNFINDLTKDLMPYIEQNYSVKTGRENTAITGFSMGGRESLLIGMQRSDLFGYVGAICPAPGVTGAFKWDSGKEPYLLMITGGSNDTVVYSNPETYHNNFAGNNVPHIWHYVNGGYHGDNSIHAHLYNFCRFVFQATE